MHRLRIKWVLKDRIPIPCDDLFEWARWLESARDERIVAATDIDDTITVSTVFLGLDHQHSSDPDAPPILFETMVFGDETTIKWPDGHLSTVRESLEYDFFGRYSTYAEAQKGHEETCARVRAAFEAAASVMHASKGAVP